MIVLNTPYLEVNLCTEKEYGGDFKRVANTISDFYRQETALTCAAALKVLPEQNSHASCRPRSSDW